MIRKCFLLAVIAIAISAFALALVLASPLRRATPVQPTQDDPKCYYAFRTISSGSGGGGGSWPFQCGNQASAKTALKKCTDYVISEFDDDEQSALRLCNCIGCDSLTNKSTRSSGSSNAGTEESRTASRDTSAPGTPDATDTDDSDRASERTRLFNQQSGRTTVVNPDGTQSTKLVRRDGESDEDFRARERAALFNAQKNSKVAPDGSVDSAWTEADGKKYTQGKKGLWVVGSFRVIWVCADKMFMTTGYVQACVVDENGRGASKGTFLEIRNSSDEFPVYYGLSGVFNKKVGPRETVTEDLHMYVPIDPAKRARMPDTEVEILVKYWVREK
jgi:hypothetical protein